MLLFFPTASLSAFLMLSLLIFLTSTVFTVPAGDQLHYRQQQRQQQQQQHYHTDCFSCIYCGCQLQKGALYGRHEEEIYCEAHFLAITGAARRAATTTAAAVSSVDPLPFDLDRRDGDYLHYTANCNDQVQAAAEAEAIDQSGGAGQCHFSSKCSLSALFATNCRCC